METLPREIWDEIMAIVISFNEKDDIRSLRLVNKYLAKISAPALFASVSVWFGVQSLQHLTNISRHYELAQYVHEIRFSPLQIRRTEQPSSRGFLNLRDNLTKNDLYASEILEQIERDAQYQRYRAAQVYLLKTHAALELLRSAFCRLPGVQKIDILLMDRSTGAKELGKFFGDLEGTEYYWDLGTTLPLLFTALKALPSPLHCFRFQDTDNTWSPKKRLRNSSGSYTRHSIGMKALLQLSQDHDFTHLETLELNYYYSEPIERDKRNQDVFDQYSASVKTILHRAPHLKSMRIQIPGKDHQGDEGEAENRYRFTKALSEEPCLHLTSLELIDLTISVAAPLSAMLAKHFFKLRHVLLQVGDNPRKWLGFLAAQRRPGWHVLRSFKMVFYSYALVTEEPDVEVAAFVRMKVLENPLLPCLYPDSE
ncbi:uncharacterized protein KY384_006268 [Bacidia gigantensis]|uniref:uncharacterized protein n=1 Tax=Bacidia gigantensis TaxID=2732470 RepID=UPI001D05A669|nr:uncharacterized protein KY384_006268 [Bacidia gigantensis]KAG8528581.1 hypothetical protein KY384_006268 [Bacidia gigantensis]